MHSRDTLFIELECNDHLVEILALHRPDNRDWLIICRRDGQPFAERTASDPWTVARDLVNLALASDRRKASKG